MTAPSFLICIGNEGADDLQILKVYRQLADEAAEPRGMVRVIDDSGEDYLYPRALFLSIPPVLAEHLDAIGAATPSKR